MKAPEPETHSVFVMVTSAVYACLSLIYAPISSSYLYPSIKIPIWSYAASVSVSRICFTDYYVNILPYCEYF